MKLFIPTSSLNFNNIMSCESVSPFAFYMQRNFGYKTFEKVELNKLNNSLLLYEDFPKFQIPESEIVNYPMVVEVDIDSEYEGLNKLQNGIWQIDRTVYLNPFSSRIYFYTSEHKRTILSRSDSSAETKLVNLYMNNIEVFQGEMQEYNLNAISDLPSLNHQEVENDNQKNKIKGFAYAYLIAANNSTSKENVQLKNLINKIINLSSAIVNSVSGYGTQQQNDELKHLLQKLNAYQYSDVKEFLKITFPDQFNEVWNKLYYQFGLRIPSKYNFENYYHSLTDKTKYETVIQDLKNLPTIIIGSNNNSSFKLGWDNIALVGNRLTQYDDDFIPKAETREMYQNLINDIFVSTDITESSFSSERSRLADEITRKIKSYIGEEQWKSHDANKYLNNLRRNIAGQEAFNINWNTGLISAIAAFLLKGEDFEKLNDFLISIEIEDGRLAFGLYGCICGYANLSRVFTSYFYNSDLEYLTKTYKTIYKQLHNIELSGDLTKVEKTKSITTESKINLEEKEESYSNNDFDILFKEIEFNVPDFLDIKLKKDRQFYKTEMSKLYSGEISENFIKSLEKLENPKGTVGKWKKVISYLKNKSKQKKDSKSTKYLTAEQTSMFFDNGEKQPFMQDYNAFDKISSLIPRNEQKKVKSEIEWIQKVHQENGYEKKGRWVVLDKHSNEEVINHLKNNVSKKREISQKTIEIMIGELIKRYS